MQEASKHVARLKDQNFVEKNPSDGYYTLTTLGKLVIKLLPSIEFLFIERIGELQEHQYNAKAGLVLSFTHLFYVKQTSLFG